MRLVEFLVCVCVCVCCVNNKKVCVFLFLITRQNFRSFESFFDTPKTKKKWQRRWMWMNHSL
jgi:hypothetical protein